jgi:hypothetical protein
MHQLPIPSQPNTDPSALEKEGVEIKINPETQNLNW